MNGDEIPEIKTGDPVPEGKYDEVLPDGTRRMVFAKPFYRPTVTPTPPVPRWRRLLDLLTRPAAPFLALLLVAAVALAWSAGWWLPLITVVAFGGLSWLTTRWLRRRRG